MTFDPACEFLLTLAPPNLFEGYDFGEYVLRCKGCGESVKRTDVAKHQRSDRRKVETAKRANARKAQAANLAKARKARGR